MCINLRYPLFFSFLSSLVAHGGNGSGEKPEYWHSLTVFVFDRFVFLPQFLFAACLLEGRHDGRPSSCLDWTSFCDSIVCLELFATPSALAFCFYFFRYGLMLEVSESLRDSVETAL